MSKIKLLQSIGVAGLLFTACVPLKKYKELEANYNQCMEDQNAYKSTAIDYESKMNELQTEYDLMKSNLDQIVKDTTALRNEFNALQVEYDKLGELNQVLEEKYTQLQNSGSAESAKLIQDLEGTRIELQRKEDRLNELEKELNERALILDQKEKKIKELEDEIAAKDAATKALKEKIAQALLGFADQGLTIEEKNGRIYVRMEAKLLFPSGKTTVSSEGQKALINLAQILESQEDIGVLVEGHTDTDPLKSSSHPTDNWELSVLRATAVTKIMLDHSKMDPTMITAAGRSEYIPVDPNDKSKNRRIEIIITPDLTSLFDLISTEE